jgi:hypothetical protein
MKLYTILFAIFVSSNTFAGSNPPAQLNGCSVNIVTDTPLEDMPLLVPKLLPYGVRLVQNSIVITNVKVSIENTLGTIELMSSGNYLMFATLPLSMKSSSAHAKGVSQLVPYIISACGYAQPISSAWITLDLFSEAPDTMYRDNNFIKQMADQICQQRGFTSADKWATKQSLMNQVHCVK